VILFGFVPKTQLHVGIPITPTLLIITSCQQSKSGSTVVLGPSTLALLNNMKQESQIVQQKHEVTWNTIERMTTRMNKEVKEMEQEHKLAFEAFIGSLSGQRL
jgi:hypothetical protein